MKTLALFILAAFATHAPSANAEEKILLWCQIGYAPLEAVKVIANDAGLMIYEKRLGDSWTSRPLEEAQWKARELRLEDPEDEITGTLTKVGPGWNYHFTRSDGWHMIGGADCAQ